MPFGGGYGRFRRCYDRTYLALECGKLLLYALGLACIFATNIIETQNNDPARHNKTLEYQKPQYLFQFYCYKISLTDVKNTYLFRFQKNYEIHFLDFVRVPYRLIYIHLSNVLLFCYSKVSILF